MHVRLPEKIPEEMGMDDSQREAISRRMFVLGAGGMVAAGLSAAPKMAMAIGGGTEITGFFDVTKPPYSAPATGLADAKPGIQAAVDAAAANGGGVVWLPPGVYRLNSQVVVPSQVTIAGAGWSTPSPDSVGSPTNATGNGTWISIASTVFTPLLVRGSGVVIRDIAFIHQQATSIASGWAPVNYPYAIEINGPDALLENIFLRNATRGIIIRGPLERPGVAIGRVVLKHIWGQPIISGVHIDNVLDVVKIEDVHFWPFWSYCTIVSDYQRYGANFAFTVKRCDNPHFTNIFVLGYRRGFYFTGGPQAVIEGITSRFLMTNCGTDFTVEGIYIDGPGTSGAISNYYSLGGTNGQAGINVDASGVLLQCSNIRITAVNNNAIRVSGAGTVVTIENIIVENWNQGGYGFPAIECNSSATTYVGFNRVFLTSSGPLTGGSGTIKLDQ